MEEVRSRGPEEEGNARPVEEDSLVLTEDREDDGAMMNMMLVDAADRVRVEEPVERPVPLSSAVIRRGLTSRNNNHGL